MKLKDIKPLYESQFPSMVDADFIIQYVTQMHHTPEDLDEGDLSDKKEGSLAAPLFIFIII